MMWKRILKHWLTPGWWAGRMFDRASLDVIEKAIGRAESGHAGELRFVVEGPLSGFALWRGQTARARAADVFANLRVWDTEHNSGILIYVQLVDRRVEILADRGIAARVPQAEWERICRGMEAAFKVGAYRDGALAALDQAAALLRRHFPRAGEKPNELSDQPLVM